MATSYPSSKAKPQSICGQRHSHWVSGRSGLSTKRKLSTMSSDEEERSDDELASITSEPRLSYEVVDSKRASYSKERQSKRLRVLNPFLIAYLQLFEDEVIQDFLWVDSCAKLADKYLLAMVYVYFRRAGLTLDSYNRTNFFIALYLANDIEEDEEDEKYEIFPWALGKGWMTQFPVFLRSRDKLWHAMGFRAIVSRRTCEEIFAMAPYHEIWERRRFPHHGGAIRSYLRSSVPAYGRSSPAYCSHCKRAQLRQKEAEQSSIISSIKLDFLDEIDLSLKDPNYGTKANGHLFKVGTRHTGICHEE